MIETKRLHAVFFRRMLLVTFVSSLAAVSVYAVLIPASFPGMRTYAPLLMGAAAIVSFGGAFVASHRKSLEKAAMAAMCFQTILLCLGYVFLVVAVGILTRGS